MIAKLIKFDEVEKFWSRLTQRFHIYSPVLLEGGGRYSDTDMVRYSTPSNFLEIEWKTKSYYSPKEIVFPIIQELYEFSEEGDIDCGHDDREALIFLRPCDINGIHRLDKQLGFGTFTEDPYYAKKRRRIRFALMECPEPFDNCFCVAMGSNTTEDFEIAVRVEDNHILVQLHNDEYVEACEGIGCIADFDLKFPQRNGAEVVSYKERTIPADISKFSLWDEYAQRCTDCGICNAVCISDAGSKLQKIPYSDDKSSGLVRRVWNTVVGDVKSIFKGENPAFRKNKMLVKTYFKTHDSQEKFGEAACVGCGRCDDACPEYISFSQILNKTALAVEHEGSE